MKRTLELLSKFPNYEYAQRVLQDSLLCNDVQLDGFSGDPDPQNLALARSYDAWDPPPSNDEWKTEERLLVTIVTCFRAALGAYRVSVG